MSRGIGEFEPIQELLPEWMAVVIALITQLGDAWFLGLLLLGMYWSRPRDQDTLAFIGGTALLGIAVVEISKNIFSLPRPEQPLLDSELLPWIIRPFYELTAFAGGYGFPSGHAVNATIVYLGLALLLTGSRKRDRLVVASLLVMVIGFSRIALGVHYVVDVIAGIGVGLLIIWVSTHLYRRVSGEHTSIVVGVTIIIGTVNLLIYGEGPLDIALVTISLGYLGGWQLLMMGGDLFSGRAPSQLLVRLLVRFIAVIFTIGSLFWVLESSDPLSFVAGAALAGLITALLVVIPVIRYSHRVRSMTQATSFWVRALAVGTLSFVQTTIKYILHRISQ